METTENIPYLSYKLDIDNFPPLDPSSSPKSIQKFIADHVKRDYAKYHSPRYAHILNVLAEHVNRDDQSLLDIGGSELTDLIRHAFQRKMDVLDYHEDRVTERGKILFFDLNTVDRPEDWRTDIGRYDVVVMAEVFEHLYASPQSIFRFLKTLVSPSGILVIQTPNGVALRRRIPMLFGRNPYGVIRDGDKLGSHVREYTIAELTRYGTEQGFKVESASLGSYFDVRFSDDKSPARVLLKRIVYALTLPNMRPGITMVFRAPLS